MATKRITTAVVEAMQPGEAVWDSETRGFGVRYRARDRVYLIKTRIKGRQRILTIGRHGKGAWGPERARGEAIRLLGLIRDGRNPAAERDADKATPTLATFAARFMEEYAAAHYKPRTRAEAEGLLRRYIIPALGTMKLGDIGKAEVARLHAAQRVTPIAANRAVALLSSIFGWAEKVGERPDGTNPCQHVDRFREQRRERLLGAAELAKLGGALRHAETRGTGGRATPEDWRAIAAFRLLIFTGARLSEILTLRWEWIDAAAGLARLPDSKTGAKNLYLPPGALAVLEALPRMAGNPHVLPGNRPGAPFVGVQKPWQRVRALAGLPDLRLHDLRHSFASTAVAAGDSLFIVGKLLGHRQVSTTERYAHLAPDPAKAVADRTAERLRALLAGTEGGTALPLRRGAG
jgi:integrase